MFAKSVLLAALIAYAEARFNQEQIPISAISAVQGGAPGAAATIAGGAISTLLGAADPCDKLRTADDIITQLGTGADALAAAIGLVTAEKNTNPSNNDNAQIVCADASLPATQALRGITPLIDPAADGADAVNALSASTAATPLDATGKSVFDLVEAAAPGVVQAAGAAGGAAAGGAAAGGNNAAAGGNDAAQAANNTAQAGGNDAAQQAGDNTDDANACDAQAAAPAANETAAAGGNDQQAAAGGATGNVVGDADFGKCTPTITFEAGRPGRKADEFTFQIGDPLARGGQQDALNPAIITNALCNQLNNVCGANQAALDSCAAAKAKADALTTRDKAVADTFNTAIGFPGAVTNPDGGPADVAAAARMMRRGYRMMD
ncbi:hypothetical protein BDV96DRAFT_639353 [Lophiotrema nucula]|uniref:Circumsporozoite protein n=1 Tax=Lophiotrema nucula TaxID=690887 RepID=A0A6A5ZTI6_9PLEO|nr:hypothetical protein BDV96DRAFT_639353 [Lophiotrema nucula]